MENLLLGYLLGNAIIVMTTTNMLISFNRKRVRAFELSVSQKREYYQRLKLQEQRNDRRFP